MLLGTIAHHRFNQTITILCTAAPLTIITTSIAIYAHHKPLKQVATVKHTAPLTITAAITVLQTAQTMVGMVEAIMIA